MLDGCRRIFLFLFFAVLIGFTPRPMLGAPTAEKRSASPESMVGLIHDRRGNWIALKAGLNLEFLTPRGRKIACRGELVYQRLDEKILLKGFNEKNELLFVFKTLDRNFELYLPLIAEDTRGSIFDLEDSPEIQSHLRALDLYRALKPGAIPMERMTSLPKRDGNVSIRIKKGKSGTLLSRELLVSPKGDVLEEVFYSPEGMPAVEITRSDFSEIRNKTLPKTVFPRRIEITAHPLQPEGGVKKTVLTFSRLELLSAIPESDFAITLPENTKRVNLENKPG